MTLPDRIPVVVAAWPLANYRLDLLFDDGCRGVVDVSSLTDFHGVFAPLLDPAEFERVRVDEELGTVAWPGGADLDPLVLYAAVKGESIDF